MSTTTMDVLAALPSETPAPKPSLMRMLLKGDRDLNAQLQQDTALPSLVIGMLGMSVAGFALQGVATGVAAQMLRAHLSFQVPHGHPALWLPLALVGSLIGALGICLPVFYFCSQMAGLDAPMRVIAAQALRANATSAALLFGLLPFYVALALGSIAGLPIDADIVVWAGLALPFAVGLIGVRTVYIGFADLARAAPAESGMRRRSLLFAMVICAVCVYALVAPVALYRLSETLSQFL